jgi:hypothetical protein
MTSDQRRAFIRIVEAYVGHMADGVVAQYAELLNPDAAPDAAFAWAGSDQPAAPHYYRVQSERLLIEYDCTQNDANHTHSVWRDPTGDFGGDPLGQHYAAAHR